MMLEISTHVRTHVDARRHALVPLLSLLRAFSALQWH